MDPETYNLLVAFNIPPEIIALIDDILCEGYRRNNAANCAALIRKSIRYYLTSSVGSSIYVNKKETLCIRECECGGPVFTKIYRNYYVSLSHETCKFFDPGNWAHSVNTTVQGIMTRGVYTGPFGEFLDDIDGDSDISET